MQTDFVERFLWPMYWAELAVFILLSAWVMSKGAVGGIVTFAPVLFLAVTGAVVSVSGSPSLRRLFAAALAFGAWTIVMGFATFLMDKMKR
ncbi:MAG: hypothetical protein JNK48_21050 [Bryobacterales bacterium]|nr:hypothetical protein [Bryobacterales bacterium]